ncbi:MAG TPA: diacylglycerol kinase [Candidatus Saccharimonadia bacterium]|jgi:diacylglycerol kinase|nr:diacylglycerol kinase [Candidatus Saccharimonadia bacterium]
MTAKPTRLPGVRGDWEAGKIALKAFAMMVRRERVVKYQLVATAVVVAAGFWRGFGPGQWLFVAIFAGWPIYAEMNNATHEATGTRISAKPDHGVGVIKDKAAGTVVVPTLIALFIALPVLFLSAPGW